MPFEDRQDAGNRLADRLEEYRDRNAVVLALPRGGVAVALPVALRLEAPLELLLVRKIGVPGDPEVAMGAIVDGSTPVIVRNADVLADAHIPEDVFDAAAKRELAEIERRRSVYFCGQRPLSLRGRIAIVIDDGIATGATLRAALGGLESKRPARIVVAVPVAPTPLIEELKRQVDDVVCLEPLGTTGAVGAHYLRFEQLDDDEVVALMKAAPRPDGQSQKATADNGN